MYNMKKHIKVMSFILSVVMLVCSVSVMAFAADYSFRYYFSNDEKTEIYVTGFNGIVPEDGSVEIPATIDGYKVVGIAEHTFDDLDELKTVVIPSTVTYIDENAFFECPNIQDVTIKNPGEIDIGENVFDATKWYEDHKSDYVISGTTLTSYKGSDEIVAIPYNCTKIADGAFKNNTSIMRVYLANELTSIGNEAFAGCTKLKDVILGDSMTDLSIGKNAFADTKWLNDFPSTFVIIGTTLVKYKGSESYVKIPNMITTIAAGAFTMTDLTATIPSKIKVPTSVKNFGDDCFFLYKSASNVYPEILAYESSAAIDYCEKADLAYKIAAMPGDANLDGKTTAADARYVLRVSAKLEKPITSSEILEVADLSNDGLITAEDARLILRLSAQVESFNAQQILTKPSTDYETLMLATNALSLAKAYGCAYSKTAYQTISKSNMNANTQTYFAQFKNELTPEKKAETVTYKQDSKEALENLFDITLLDASKIKSYKCIVNDDNYEITIVLNDEKIAGSDTAYESFTSKMFPVAPISHFTNTIASQYWYKLGSTKFDYSMTYTNCTLKMIVDIATTQIQGITLSMSYYFDVSDGKIVGLPIKDGSGKAGANATRVDTIEYTNFVYVAQSTEAAK